MTEVKRLDSVEVDPLEMLNVDLEREVIKAVPAPQPVSALGGPVKKLNYSHEAMVDQIISNPGISQNALAAKFGYSPSWISQVISSDMFQELLAKRKNEIVDPVVRATVEDHFKGLISRSLDLLKEKLNKPAAEIPDNLVLRTLEISSRAMGYGARTDTTKVEVEVSVDEHLEKLSGNLTRLLERKKLEAIEGTATLVNMEDEG